MFMLTSIMTVKANSVSTSGYGFTVNGYMCSTYTTSTVTGFYSGGSTATVQVYCHLASGKKEYRYQSGTSYTRLNKPSDVYQWIHGYVKGIIYPAEGGSVSLTTTMMYPN